ncbi:MAG: TIGR00730 family Rossman fold protein [Actinobacteria bacterium]|nr:TIGR00730 family Rossman fold protein [Actinomycetota bacterium]MCB9388773.1 TIGR00730 family Rossman fold protein [Acidimicrobiia bacterium]
MSAAHDSARERLSQLLTEHPHDARFAAAILQDLHEEQTAFSPYRGTSKVAIFGSARAETESPEAAMAAETGRCFVRAGWMVTTGGGPGIMAAATQGAGTDQAFAIDINLPFEYDTAGFPPGDPKVVHSEFFFTRKLAFFRQSDAFVVFPGGLGTMDELFELLTLMQTGRTRMAPVVLAEPAGGRYWAAWLDFIDRLAAESYISRDDLAFVEVAHDATTVVALVTSFWSNLRSFRVVDDHAVFSVERVPPAVAHRLDARASATSAVPYELQMGVTASIEAASSPTQPGGQTTLNVAVPFDGRQWSLLRRVITELNAW